MFHPQIFFSQYNNHAKQCQFKHLRKRVLASIINPIKNLRKEKYDEIYWGQKIL